MLSAGDLIQIRVFEQPDYTPEVRISADGSVLLPLIGTIDLNGKTISQAERIIEQHLIDAIVGPRPGKLLQVDDLVRRMGVGFGQGMHYGEAMTGPEPLARHCST